MNAGSKGLVVGLQEKQLGRTANGETERANTIKTDRRDSSFCTPLSLLVHSDSPRRFLLCFAMSHFPGFVLSFQTLSTAPEESP